MSIWLRSYVATDAPATLQVFLRAIRETAAGDYSPVQIEAWAQADPEGWASRRAQLNAVVAVVDEAVVGFTDVTPQGYIDALYVDPAYGRRGVATALLGWAVREGTRSGAQSFTTHASITARPFFEAHGFIVRAERRPVRRGVALTNYAMTRPLSGPMEVPED